MINFKRVRDTEVRKSNANSGYLFSAVCLRYDWRFIQSMTDVFLWAIAGCFARFSHGLGVCPSVRLSVRHTLAMYQNGDTYHEIFTVGCREVSSFS